MRLLVLGGTAWLGHEVAATGIARGYEVTCLARGAGPLSVPAGARLVRADRTRPDAYAEVAAGDWDAVVDVARQPGQVRGALAALADRARHWTCVSTANVYADHSRPGADESTPLLAPAAGEEVPAEQYGEGKVACEDACRAALDDRLLVARCGLVGGPGDHTDRSGAWVARAAAGPRDPLLVPATPDLPTQVVDVRDLVAWLLDCARDRRTGTFDAVGPLVPFGEWVDLARRVGGHTGPVVDAPADWLIDQGVTQFMGTDSLAMWLVEPGWEGFCARTGAAAVAAGLRHRPREQVLTDLLAWERTRGLHRSRAAGLSTHRERTLLSALTSGDSSLPGR